MKIIAEIGLNHNGNILKALEMIDAAVEAGAKAVKFQVTDAINTIDSSWWKDDVEMFNKIRSFELNDDDYGLIKDRCRKHGVQFIITPSTINKLLRIIKYNPDVIKIGSDRANDKSLVYCSASFNKPVLVSDGMYSIDYDLDNVYKMYCISKYPAETKDYKYCDLSDYSGLSDHTLETGIEIPLMCYSKNIQYIEKHFKIDEDCIDNKVSLNPEQFALFCDNADKARRLYYGC